MLLCNLFNTKNNYFFIFIEKLDLLSFDPIKIHIGTKSKYIWTFLDILVKNFDFISKSEKKNRLYLKSDKNSDFYLSGFYSEYEKKSEF